MNPEHLGYALTVVYPMGVTIGHTFRLGRDSLVQKAGYTHLSHGRLSNSLYATAPENPRQEVGRNAEDTKQRNTLQSLVDAMSQIREQTIVQYRLLSWPALSVQVGQQIGRQRYRAI
ncbi:MAG: hypothetical protein ACLP5O_02330 [Acidimicrobiales bacterium]|jgi:hypothetical protein